MHCIVWPYCELFSHSEHPPVSGCKISLSIHSSWSCHFKLKLFVRRHVLNLWLVLFFVPRIDSSKVWRDCSIRIQGTDLQKTTTPIIFESDRLAIEFCGVQPVLQPKAGRKAKWASKKWLRSKILSLRPQEIKTASLGGPHGACKYALSPCLLTRIFWGLCRCLYVKQPKTRMEKKTLQVRCFQFLSAVWFFFFCSLFPWQHDCHSAIKIFWKINNF